MKKQVNLAQSDLYNVIKESVKNVILEFGTDPGKKGDENRTKMAKAAKRAVKKGNFSVYKNAYDSIVKGGGNKEALSDFQKKFEDEVEESRNLKEYTEFDKMKMYGQDVDYDEDFENLEDSENLEEYNDIDLQSIYGRPSYDEDFEDVGFNQQPSNVVTGEGRKPVKVTESQLKDIIRESVMRILQEAADHKITYNGQDYTLNADNQSSWYQLGDIRKDMAKPYEQMADAADAEVDRISDQEGYRKNPQLFQQYQDARNQVKQNSKLAGKYEKKAWRNNQHGYDIAKNDLEKFNQHLDNYLRARK